MKHSSENMETANISSYVKQERDQAFKCDFCPLNFDDRNDWNQHILKHFVHKSCLGCDKNLIRIGDKWYELHVTINCCKEDNDATYYEEMKVEPLDEIDGPFNNDNFTELTTSSDTLELESVKMEKVSPEIPNEITVEPNINVDDSLGSNKFVCAYCYQIYERIHQLKKHINGKHIDQTTQDCSVCFESFLNVDTLIQHVEKKHKFVPPTDASKTSKGVETKYVIIKQKDFDQLTIIKVKPTCEYCNKQFATEFELKRHLPKHTGEHAFTCKIAECRLQFKYLDYLRKHEIACHDMKPHPCKIAGCTKQFTHFRLLKKHEREHHSDQIKQIKRNKVPKNFKCSHCEKTLTSNRSLANHLITHAGNENLYSCTICDKKVKSAGRLRVHEKTHAKLQEESQESFRCTFKDCTKTFKHKDSLNTHLLGHDPNVKRLQCDSCTASFLTEPRLKRHQRLVHIAPKQFMCNVCGSQLNSNSALRDHINSHTGNRPYKCDECSKCFTHDCLLRNHKRIHNGKKVTCPIEGCDRSYTYLIDLQRHKFSAHGIYTKKHICPICEKVYSERKLLRKHMESHNFGSLQ